jgi:hypothetical protein
MEMDPWSAVLRGIAGNLDLLSHTPVVLVWRDKEGEVQSRCIALSNAPIHVWGLDCLQCPRPNCGRFNGNFRAQVHRTSRTTHEKARFCCVECGYRTKWLVKPEWVHELPMYPHRFWYAYPIDQVNHAALVEQLLCQSL